MAIETVMWGDINFVYMEEKGEESLCVRVCVSQRVRCDGARLVCFPIVVDIVDGGEKRAVISSVWCVLSLVDETVRLTYAMDALLALSNQSGPGCVLFYAECIRYISQVVVHTGRGLVSPFRACSRLHRQRQPEDKSTTTVSFACIAASLVLC